MINRIMRAIQSIEDNLYEDRQLERAASAACYSPYHFSRIFLAFTGMTIGVYVRRRRLTKAAESLIGNNSRIIEIAQNSGFESQAAFSRAFKDMFNETPADFRNGKFSARPKGQLAFTETYLNHLQTGGVTMIPRLEYKEAFSAIGLGAEFDLSKPHEIGALWDKFFSRIGEIEQAQKEIAYGICFASEDHGTNPDKFHYAAAVRVSDNLPVPEGMEKISIAAQKYAIFTHKGQPSELSNTYEYIFKTWLPKSGIEPASAPIIEVYGSKWKIGSQDSEMEICLPIAA